jgi:hypothetical protein
MAAPTVAEVTRIAEMDDGTIASLYPQYQQYVRLLRTEGMDALGRVLHGEHKPEQEYSAQRARLLGQLARLDDIEGRLKEEKEKTGRTTYMAAAQIVMALAGIEKAGVTAKGNVLAAQMDAWTKRLTQLDKDNDVNGPRTMGDLDAAALRSVGAIGRAASGGTVTDGVTFATELQKGLQSITDDRLITPYLDQIQERTGVKAAEWLMGQPTNVPIAPIVKGAQDRITAGLAAEEKAIEIKIANDEEAKLVTDRLRTNIGVESGSMLGRAFNNFEQATGVSPLTSTGGTTTTTTTTPGADGAAGEPSAVDETRKRINDELDRLQNGTDSASQKAREQLLVSPQLAEWAERNGYTSFRPEQKLRAFVAFAKKRVEEQDDAFRAKLDADIRGGRIKAPTIRGEVINQVGARVRQAVRGIGRPSADLTGGAAGPGDTAPEIPESTARDAGPEPTAEDMAKKETSDDVYAGEIERGMEDVSRTGPAVTSVQALRGRTTAPEKPRSSIEQMLATRPQNEAAVQRVLNNPTYSWAKPEYEKLQALKSTDPVGYATGLDELAVRVRNTGPRTGEPRVGRVVTPPSKVTDMPTFIKPETVPFGEASIEAGRGSDFKDIEDTEGATAEAAPETRKRRGGLLRRLFGRDAEAAPTPAPAPVSTSPVEPTASVEAGEAPAPASAPVPAPVPAAPTVTRTAAGAGGFEYAELSDGTIKITKDKSGPVNRVVAPASKAYTAIKTELDKTAPAPAPAPAPAQAPAPTQPPITFGELAPETPPGFQPTTPSNVEAAPSPDLAKSPSRERTEQRPILPTFKSFGAEAATSQAQQAMDAYQQALIDRRMRRRQMLGVEPDPGLYEMGLRR